VDKKYINLEVSTFYQGVHQPLIRSDQLSESSTPPLPDMRDHRLTEDGDDRLTEDGFFRLTEE
jgi:hypothetical protein